MTEPDNVLRKLAALLALIETAILNWSKDPDALETLAAESADRLALAGYTDNVRALRNRAVQKHISQRAAMVAITYEARPTVEDANLGLLVGLGEARRLLIAFQPAFIAGRANEAALTLYQMIEEHAQELTAMELQRAQIKGEQLDEVGCLIGAEMTAELTSATEARNEMFRYVSQLFLASMPANPAAWRTAIETSEMLVEDTLGCEIIRKCRDGATVEELKVLLAAWIANYLEEMTDEEVAPTTVMQAKEQCCGFSCVADALNALTLLVEHFDRQKSQLPKHLAATILDDGAKYVAFFEVDL